MLSLIPSLVITLMALSPQITRYCIKPKHSTGTAKFFMPIILWKKMTLSGIFVLRNVIWRTIQIVYKALYLIEK